MTEEVTLECSYTPAAFFEEPVTYSENGYSVYIGNGRIVATLSSGIEPSGSLYPQIYQEIETRFLAAQLSNDKPYQLSGYTTTRRLGGSVEVGVSGITLVASTNVRCDVVILDANGNVKSDTKRERIEARIEDGRRASKHRNDPVLATLLKSYKAAIADPQNELIHLYEVRDALAKKFGKDAGARFALHNGKDLWSRLGELANKAPLSQGRHRGRNIGRLREATESELVEAREIVRLIIRAYLHYLDAPVPKGPIPQAPAR